LSKQLTLSELLACHVMHDAIMMHTVMLT
jgi:hypothetical protein